MEKKPELWQPMLLAVDHVFRAPNLVGAGRVCVTLIECRQLRLKPLACRVRRLCVGRGQSKSNRHRGGHERAGRAPHGRHSSLKTMLGRAFHHCARATSERRFQSTPEMMISAPRRTNMSNGSL